MKQDSTATDFTDEILSKVPEKEARAIIYVLGLEGNPMTLREAAETEGVTHETIRQRMRRGLMHLRHPSTIKMLLEHRENQI